MSITSQDNRRSSAQQNKWDEAIADAEARIRKLRNTIRVFKARKDAGDAWPGPGESRPVRAITS